MEVWLFWVDYDGSANSPCLCLGFPPILSCIYIEENGMGMAEGASPQEHAQALASCLDFWSKIFHKFAIPDSCWFCRVKDVGWSHSGASYFCLKADRPMIHFPPTPSMCERSYCCVCAAGWDLCIGATCIQFVTFCPNRLVDIGNEDHTERDRAALYLFLILLRMHSDADLNKSSLTHSFKSLVLRSILTQYL